MFKANAQLTSLSSCTNNISKGSIHFDTQMGTGKFIEIKTHYHSSWSNPRENANKFPFKNQKIFDLWMKPIQSEWFDTDVCLYEWMKQIHLLLMRIKVAERGSIHTWKSINEFRMWNWMSIQMSELTAHIKMEIFHSNGNSSAQWMVDANISF